MRVDIQTSTIGMRHPDKSLKQAAVGCAVACGILLVSPFTAAAHAAGAAAPVPGTGGAAPERFSASSVQQYTLQGSDGVTWTTVDAPGLAVTFTPSSTTPVVFTGNADMWTEVAGFNQDLGICVATGSTAPATCAQPIAWHESGGFAGTFSPNAAAVQGVGSVTSGTEYTAFLVWKANVAMPSGDRIHIGAGAAGSGYSPTSLTVQLYGTSGVTSAVSNQQSTMHGSDGSSWEPLDGSALTMSITYPSATTYELTANADLWTETSGFNQDIGINVSPACANDSGNTLAAWKESGGAAGTYSPNAAFLQTVCVMNGGTQYTVTLVWKANQLMASDDVIAAGAGPAGGPFSPTSLVAMQYPGSNPLITGTASTAQYQLNSSDGRTWQQVDASHLALTVTPGWSCVARLTGNADVWTQSAGFNQDLGIEVTPAGGSSTLAAWKESGGFAGTFSPNAAFVQGTFAMVGGTQYTISLVWKSNTSMPAGDLIRIGAGPVDSAFSPTFLAFDFDC